LLQALPLELLLQALSLLAPPQELLRLVLPARLQLLLPEVLLQHLRMSSPSPLPALPLRA